MGASTAERSRSAGRASNLRRTEREFFSISVYRWTPTTYPTISSGRERTSYRRPDLKRDRHFAWTWRPLGFAAFVQAQSSDRHGRSCPRKSSVQQRRLSNSFVPNVSFELSDRKALQIGPFIVTPYLVDHSAYDAYALLIEAGGRRLSIQRRHPLSWSQRCPVRAAGEQPATTYRHDADGRLEPWAAR